MAFVCAPSSGLTFLATRVSPLPALRACPSSRVDAAVLSDEEGLFVQAQSENAAPNYTEESIKGVSPALLAREITRRRNFAIISHPDAGKTTRTEKLLLYGGAIHEAGAVKARRASRHATSDWMELEKQRGISITSTAMAFETRGYQITLLDTPGHQDFGEDTYRTLAAADNAVMLVDAGKGLEPQTRKLFEASIATIGTTRREFGLSTYPVSWPIGSGDRFVGVYYRPRQEVHLFEKGRKHGSLGATVRVVDYHDPTIKSLIAPDLYEQLEEEIEMLEELTPALDFDKIRSGDLSPVYFGSAMNNFGVELFLESFLDYSVQPGPHQSDIGVIPPENPSFSGFVFKLQANMDPKHRDKVAFLRVCSGQFTKGMKVQISRTGRTIALSRPQKMFAQDRSTVETGFAGDVIGLNNPNAFCIGDTVHTGRSYLRSGKELHAEAIATCNYVATALINMYAKCSSMVEARQLFDIKATGRGVMERPRAEN